MSYEKRVMLDNLSSSPNPKPETPEANNIEQEQGDNHGNYIEHKVVCSK